jgi:hypothetical protein
MALLETVTDGTSWIIQGLQVQEIVDESALAISTPSRHLDHRERLLAWAAIETLMRKFHGNWLLNTQHT